MSDVLFKGVFDLSDALADFNRFADEIQRRLGKLSQQVGQQQSQRTKNRVLDLMGINEREFEQAEQKVTQFKQRVQEALRLGLIDPGRAEAVMQQVDNRLTSLATRVERLNYKIQENIAFTKSDILALRQINNELETFDNRIAKAERTLATTNLRIRENAKQFNEFFRATVIGGFALQQLGTFLTYNLTMPMIRAGKEIAATTMRFDTLEQLMKRAGRSSTEIAGSIDLVGKTAKLRNFDLETATTLYSRLFEATRGAIDDQLFERVSKGLSQVMSTIEGGEKRAFFGQIQDILGGGDVANLEKTLSLAPALKTVYDEIKVTAGEAATQQEILLRALDRLANQPQIDDLATKVKNLGVQFQLWGQRIGQVYKDDLENLVKFIETRLFPAIEKLITYFERLDPFFQNTIAFAVALTAAIGPLIYVFGTLGVVLGGVAYVARGAALGIGALTGSTTAAKLAATDLTVLLNGAVAGGGAFGKLASFLPRLVSLLNPVTLAITAIAAVFGYTIINNINGAGDAFDRLANNALQNVTSGLTTISELIELITVQLPKLLSTFIDFEKELQDLGGIVSVILSVANVIVVATDFLGALNILLSAINDTINEGVVIAFAKLELATLRWHKRIEDAMPWIVKFSAAIAQYLTGKFAISGDPLGDRIKEQEAYIRSLGGQIEETGDKTDKANKKAGASYDELGRKLASAKSHADMLNASLKEQTKILEDVIKRSQDLTESRREEADALVYDSEVERLQREAFNIDFGDPSSVQIGQSKLEQAAQIRLQKASEAAQKDRITRLNGELARQAQEITDFAGQQSNQIFKDLYLEIAKKYQEGSDAQKMFQDIDATIDAFLGTLYETDKTAIKKAFEAKRTAITTIENSLRDTNIDILKAQRENDKMMREFREKQEENQKELRIIQKNIPLENQLIDVEGQMDSLEAERRLLLNDARELQGLSTIRADLIKIRDQQKALEEKRFKIEFDMMKNRELKVNEEWKMGRDLAKQSDANLREIDNQFNASLSQYRERVGDLRVKNLERLGNLSRTFAQNIGAQWDALNELAKSGANIDLTELQRLGDTMNVLVKNGVMSNITSGLNELSDLWANQAGTVGKSISDIDPQSAQRIGEWLNQMSNLKIDQFNDNEFVSGLIVGAEKLIPFLRHIIDTADIADPEKSANLQIFVANFIKMVESLNQGRKNLNELNDLSVTKLNTEIGQLENRLRINEALRRELDLQRELIELQQAGGGYSGLDPKGILGGILDAISGSSRALKKAQEDMIKREIEAAQIELDIALKRLEVEQRMFEIKVMGLDIAESEKQRIIESSRTEMEALKDSIIRQGELQKQILNERLDQLKVASDGIIGSIFNAIMVGIEALKGKKSGGSGLELGGIFKPSLDSSDINLDGIDIGEDPNLDLSPTFGDDISQQADKTDQSAKKVEDRYKSIGKTAAAVGQELLKLNEISMKSIRNAIAEELNALAAKAAVKALEYAAIAVSAAVFGDWGTAGRAAVAAAAWGGVAVAAKLGADLLGTADSTSTGNSQASVERQGGSYEAQTERDRIKQKEMAVVIQLDIRTDDGIIIKKNIKALSDNTELSNLTMNSQEGWAFAPAV